MPDRRTQLLRWLEALLETPGIELLPVSSDASARRYWRIRHRDQSLIAMDAPPEREDSVRFVRIAETWRALGINVPEVHAADLTRGFLLIGDLGAQCYLDALDDENADRLYGQALEALLAIQARGPTAALPPYDEALLRRELDVFSQWLLGGLLAIGPDATPVRRLAPIWDLLVDNALQQPRVCVHRDFHSRNLMVSPLSPGILDFQDAVVGPVTYDLVSLLRDCYIAWPPDRVRGWAQGYFDLAVRAGVLHDGHADRFERWMDLMGIQRHLKAAGIFARLKLRDNRPNYLRDIPRTLEYVTTVAARYAELSALAELIDGHVLPACRGSTGARAR